MLKVAAEAKKELFQADFLELRNRAIVAAISSISSILIVREIFSMAVQFFDNFPIIPLILDISAYPRFWIF